MNIGPRSVAELAVPFTEPVADARREAGAAFRRVLVALDEQPHSTRALDVALPLAAACGAEVALVHVIDPQLLVNPDGGVRSDVLRAEYERSGRSLLNTAAQRVTSYGEPRDEAAGATRSTEPLRAWQFLEYGRPAHEVVRVAGEWMADLIVVGTRRRSTMERVLLGSTAEGVLSHAHGPVLIVPALV